jgi:DNA (cytosine-5)-methyltransferase 1
MGSALNLDGLARLAAVASPPSSWPSRGCPRCGVICTCTALERVPFGSTREKLGLPVPAHVSSLLATPTKKANQLAPYMRRWPGCARLQAWAGTGGTPHPALYEWLMGFPEGWTECARSVPRFLDALASLAAPPASASVARGLRGLTGLAFARSPCARSPGSRKARRIGSLFSGIGGIELGLERAGIGRVVWQVERDPFRRAVLARHWPAADRRIIDVTRAGRGSLAPVDVICGGFPCDDVSDASRGRGGGIGGRRSGLWKHFARIIAELRPARVVVENVGGAAIGEWLPTVRRDLHLHRYGTRSLRLDARDVGAPHARARVFVVGYSCDDGESAGALHAPPGRLREASSLGEHWRGTAPGALQMVDGLPRGMDRVRALGDAVVPQCAEAVGRWMRDACGESTAAPFALCSKVA